MPTKKSASRAPSTPPAASVDPEAAAAAAVAEERRRLSRRVQSIRSVLAKRREVLRDAIRWPFGGLESWRHAHRRDPEASVAEAEGQLRSALQDLAIFDAFHGTPPRAREVDIDSVPEQLDVDALAAAEAEDRARRIEELRLADERQRQRIAERAREREAERRIERDQFADLPDVDPTEPWA